MLKQLQFPLYPLKWTFVWLHFSVDCRVHLLRSSENIHNLNQRCVAFPFKSQYVSHSSLFYSRLYSIILNILSHCIHCARDHEHRLMQFITLRLRCVAACRDVFAIFIMRCQWLGHHKTAVQYTSVLYNWTFTNCCLTLWGGQHQNPSKYSRAMLSWLLRPICLC